MLIESHPYACLGLMPGASLAEVKQHYRQLAKQYHPDTHGQTAGYEEKLRALNAAYAFLTEPSRKAAYDALFAAAFNPACASQAIQPVAVRKHSTYGHRRKSNPLTAMMAFTLFALVSTGTGLFLTNSGAPISLTSFFSQASRTADSGGDRAATAYYFIPEHSAFDAQNSPDNQAN